MNELRISDSLALPVDAVTAKLAWFGENGAGKTYAAMKLAELMWDAGAQFVGFDPVGVWPGLRTGKDGVSPGIPIVIFGGLNGDIQIGPHDGAAIADVIVGENISAVIDVSQFETDYQKAQFASDWAERFYFLKKQTPGAVHIFLEEAQEFVAENPAGGPNSKDTLMANRFQRIWKIGRNYGIGGSLISQRPQEISKKALNLSGAVFVFRLTGPHERDYMAKWLSGYGASPNLPHIATGKPYVWSPAWLGFSDFVQIGEKRTFDISATPKVGVATKARILAPVAIDNLRERFAEVVIEEDENDPKKLKARIKELEARKESVADSTILQARIEAATAPLIRRIDALESFIAEGAKEAENLASLASNLKARFTFGDLQIEDSYRNRDEKPKTPESASITAAPAPVETPEKRVKKSTPRPEGTETQSDPSVEQRILDTLAELKASNMPAPDRATLAMFVGFSPSTKSFTYALSALKTNGEIESPFAGSVALTQSGSQRATPANVKRRLKDLHATWLDRVGKRRPSARKLLSLLLASHPNPMGRAELAGLMNLALSTKSFSYALSDLRDLGITHYPSKSTVGLTKMLFPEGLK